MDTNGFLTLPLTVNDILNWPSSLPVLMRNHSRGDSVVLGIVSRLLSRCPGISVPASTSSETARRYTLGSAKQSLCVCVCVCACACVCVCVCECFAWPSFTLDADVKIPLR